MKKQLLMPFTHQKTIEINFKKLQGAFLSKSSFINETHCIYKGEQDRLQHARQRGDVRRDEGIERRAGQYVGKWRVGGGGMPHIKIQEYKGKPQRRRVGENERRGKSHSDS